MFNNVLINKRVHDKWNANDLIMDLPIWNWSGWDTPLIINPKINEKKRSNHEAKERKNFLYHQIEGGPKKSKR
jgi:hypothetical protein